METEVFKAVIEQAIGTFFGVLQALIIVSVTALFKMYWDVRQLKKDVTAAHQKLRELQ